jgi:butyryl-CoA dehydrogenase
VLAGAAAGRFGDRLKDEQEVLLALADVAIQVYAAESALLRAEKTAPSRSDAGRALAAAAVKVHTFSACEKVETAARRAAFYVGDGAAANALLRGIDRLTAYDATGLLAAKRALADAVLEGERYPF